MFTAPNYIAKISINPSGYVAPDNGYLIFNLHTSRHSSNTNIYYTQGKIWLFIDNIEVLRSCSSTSGDYNAVIVPIAKGSRVKVNSQVNCSSSFIPCQ